ncbi:hypothetical protein HYY69_02185 [Candidatus Woesearchaeota archaeon]|nr:hypothetical protein [Candidatus Woesearchaeota archaeon]
MDKLKKQEEILLDTGPLLQILVGLYDPEKLSKIEINQDQFGLLITYIQQFRKKLVTPHILAEVSNLVKIRLKKNAKELIKCSIIFLNKTDEEIIQKNAILQEKNLKLLMDFGITDTAIALSSNKNRIILTSDGPFFAYCYSNKIPAIHTEAIFNMAI